MTVITIGRSSDNDVVLSDNYVGRHHCQIVHHDDGSYMLTDLNSTNGTYVNGIRVYGEVILNPSDIVRIGNATLPWKNYFEGRTSIDNSIDKKITVGRSPDNDKVVSGESISRKHCAIIRYSDGTFEIEDYSTNGTYVNGRRISGKEPLHIGDRVSLCKTDIEWQSYFCDSDAPVPVVSDVEDYEPVEEPKSESQTSGYAILTFILGLISFGFVAYIIIYYFTNGGAIITRYGGAEATLKSFPLFLKYGGQWFAMIAALVLGVAADFVNGVLDESDDNKLSSAGMFLANAGLSLALLFVVLALCANWIAGL